MAFRAGSSGTIDVEAKKVFYDRSKAEELAQQLNEDDSSDYWVFISDSELV